MEVLMLLALAAVALAQCPVEKARYALRTEPDVTAYFRDVESGREWPGGIALATHFKGTGRTYWWLPWYGGADGARHVASTTDVRSPGWQPPSPDGGPRPRGDLDLIATNANYTVLTTLPARGGIAPAHFMLLQLSDVMWHQAGEQRDSAVRQFFDLVDCSGPEQ
jgi:hypothetical protein